MKKEEIIKLQKEKHSELEHLLAENSVRRNKMNSIAFDFFISELVGERDAKAEYKEQFYRAKENHTKIMGLKNELKNLATELTELGRK